MHGSADDFVRYSDNGKVVFESAPEPKKQIVVDGASHTDVPYIMGTREYLDELREWIDWSIRN